MGGLLVRDMDPFNRTRDLSPGQSPPTAELSYEPPRIEVVMRTSDLNRESLYAGAVGYATI